MPRRHVALLVAVVAAATAGPAGAADPKKEAGKSQSPPGGSAIQQEMLKKAAPAPAGVETPAQPRVDSKSLQRNQLRQGMDEARQVKPRRVALDPETHQAIRKPTGLSLGEAGVVAPANTLETPQLEAESDWAAQDLMRSLMRLNIQDPNNNAETHEAQAALDAELREEARRRAAEDEDESDCSLLQRLFGGCPEPD